MKWIVPVAKFAECPYDPEHFARYEIVTDDFGLVETVCPEHGHLMWFENLEFESESEAKAYVASRRADRVTVTKRNETTSRRIAR